MKEVFYPYREFGVKDFHSGFGGGWGKLPPNRKLLPERTNAGIREDSTRLIIASRTKASLPLRVY